MVLPPDGDDADLLLFELFVLDTDLLVFDVPPETLLLELLVLDLLEEFWVDTERDDSEETLLLDTDPVGLLLTDLLPLDGDDVSTLLPVVLDSEETLLLDTDLLGDDVSTLLVLTVLSGVEPLLLSDPFTCRLGVYVSTLFGLGSGFGFGGGGVITMV